MRNFIPWIHITVANPRRFLERITDIATESGLFTAHQYPNKANESFTLSLRFTGPSQHRGLLVHLVHNASARTKVAIEIRASEWVPEISPSYETYREAADILMKPLLSVYNSKERTPYRMTITSKEKLEPVLPPASDRLFRNFILSANVANLHERDWRRFYAFVRSSRAKLSEDDLAFLLVKEGFSDRYAREIAVIYKHLKDFMRPRDAAEIFEQCHVRRKALPDGWVSKS